MSRFCLSTVALGTDDSHLLSGYQDKLQQLLALVFRSSRNIIDRVWEAIYGAPEAWLLQRRWLSRADTVSVAWKVRVETVQTICKLACENRVELNMAGPITPPKAGVGWQPTLYFTPVGPAEGENSCWLGLYVGPVIPATNAVFRCKFNLEVRISDPEGRRQSRRYYHDTDEMRAGTQSGWRDVFKLGAMRGGLDMEAWQRRLLNPVELDMQLVITEVLGGDPYADLSESSSDSE